MWRKFGRHGLSCGSAGGRHPRRTHVNDIIKRALGEAHIPSTKEPKNLSRNELVRGQMVRPSCLGQTEKSLVWDYTCKDTCAASHVASTSKEAGAAAVKGEKKKLEHYSHLPPKFTIMPVANETLGSFAPMALSFIKGLGKRIADINGDKRSAMFFISKNRNCNTTRKCSQYIRYTTNTRKIRWTLLLIMSVLAKDNWWQPTS